MNANKRQKYIQTSLAVAIILLLWHPLPAISFSQKGSEAGTSGGSKASSVTMEAVSGKVVETMNSGGYTYALLKKDGAMTWVALPKSNLAVGNEITCQPGMVMNNFRSPSMNRTFDHIVFSRGITSFSGDSAPSEEAATPAPDEATNVPKIKEPENWKDF
jgi:hypothetical protein